MRKLQRPHVTEKRLTRWLTPRAAARRFVSTNGWCVSMAQIVASGSKRAKSIVRAPDHSRYPRHSRIGNWRSKLQSTLGCLRAAGTFARWTAVHFPEYSSSFLRIDRFPTNRRTSSLSTRQRPRWVRSGRLLWSSRTPASPFWIRPALLSARSVILTGVREVLVDALPALLRGMAQVAAARTPRYSGYSTDDPRSLRRQLYIRTLMAILTTL
jgi:hypothetical protein